jgi:hypothetical protein
MTTLKQTERETAMNYLAPTNLVTDVICDRTNLIDLAFPLTNDELAIINTDPIDYPRTSITDMKAWIRMLRSHPRRAQFRSRIETMQKHIDKRRAHRLARDTRCAEARLALLASLPRPTGSDAELHA